MKNHKIENILKETIIFLAIFIIVIFIYKITKTYLSHDAHMCINIMMGFYIKKIKKILKRIISTPF